MAQAAAQRRFGNFAPLHIRMPIDDIGGGRVVRPFRMNGQIVKAGTEFTGEQLRTFAPANRRELFDRYILVWPKAPRMEVGSPPLTSAATAERPERHVVSLGFDRYDVYEGKKLNLDGPILDRDEAYELAGKSAPPRQIRRASKSKGD